MKKSAKFSSCRLYRYALWRVWDDTKAHVLFIGLNPSTADELSDDPTLTRCINFAKSWGYGGVCMANLFAFRATKPINLLKAHAPIGPRNNSWLKKLSLDAALIVAAWGNSGKHQNRCQQVQQFLPQLHYLAMTKLGEPAHPLYLSAKLQPKPLDKQ